MSGILLIDEDRLIIEAVANALCSRPENAPVEYACSLAAGMSAFDSQQPDILFTELEFASGDVFSMIPRMRVANPSCRILALTGKDYDSHVEQALQAGVDGIVVKTDGLAVLNAAIAAVRSRASFFSDSIHSRIRRVDNRWQLAAPHSPRVARLSRRERQLLGYLGRGVSLKQAAADMQICFKTADNQKASLMRKLNIHDRVELTLFAVREKFVSPRAGLAPPDSPRIHPRQFEPREVEPATT